MLYFLKTLSYLIELPGVLVLLIVFFLIIYRRRMTRVGRIFVLVICVSLYLLSSELGTKREKQTTLFDTEGQFARKEFSLVAD